MTVLWRYVEHRHNDGFRRAWSHTLADMSQMISRVQPSTNRIRKISTTVVAALLLVSAAVTFSGSLTAFAASETQTFTYTGGEQTWTVPMGVVEVVVAAVGGAGGASCSCSAGKAAGGHGAAVDATVPVTPGETLYVEVGENGEVNGGNFNAGTFNGGGSAADFGGNLVSGQGGGATDVRTVAMADGSTLNSRLVVAGGGGGAGGTYGAAAVSAGGNAGASAAAAQAACTAGGGGAGTLGGGGAGGVASGSPDGQNIQGAAGGYGNGGAGFFTATGGGGGGGYYGGGSGSGCQNGSSQPYNGSGGGGGSSFIEGSATAVSTSTDTTGVPSVTLTFTAPPSVAGVSADAGVLSGGSSVTITGSSFTGATAVEFGGTPAASFTVVSDTEITAVTPGPASGVVDVTVTTPLGTSATTAADHFTYEGPPTLTSVSPTSGPSGGGETITVVGTNLTGTSAVDFGTTPASAFVIVSPTEITATAPVASPGVVDVQVTTPSGTSPITAVDQFTFIPAPVVTSIAPTGGVIAGGTTVEITGSDFTGATVVDFGSTPATSFTVLSNTLVYATSPAEAPGAVDITVITPGGTSATSFFSHYTFYSVPTITDVSPDSGSTGGGTAVTITGTHFNGLTSLTFGATAPASLTVVSDTEITATTAPESAGTVDVRVGTPGGRSAIVAADEFTFTASPVVTSVAPDAGPVAGGTAVTVTGANLTGATFVDFGSIAAASYTVVSPTEITAVTPASSAGVVDVTVTTGGGPSATTAVDHFTFALPPTVTGVTPGTGVTTGGTSVTITGTSFIGATAVDFGAAGAASFTVVSDTEITAVTPDPSAGVVNVTVTTPGGTSTITPADDFAFTVPVTTTVPETGALPSNALLITFTELTLLGMGLIVLSLTLRRRSLRRRTS